MRNFTTYAINSNLIKALNSLNYVKATDIQDIVIPKALNGESLVVQSETGSGKTHSFLIPIFNNLDLTSNKLQAIIVTPTIELAKQTFDFAKQLAAVYGNINVKLISSSEEPTKSIQSLKSNPQIIISTCGRLKDLICDESYISLGDVKTIVLDEADMILDNGFINDVIEIISKLNDPQIMVFSATMSMNLQNTLLKIIHSDVVLTTDNSNYTSKNVTHYALDTKHKPIYECISSLLKVVPNYFVIIFVSEKANIDAIYNHLTKEKYECCRFHGDLSTRERKTIMKRIRNNEFQIVICSDLAARGIDLPDCDVVINADLPNNLEFYYHRAGRTGRFNRIGNSYIFYDNDHTNKLEKLIKDKLQINFVKIVNGNLVEDKPFTYKHKYVDKKNTELEKDIKIAIYRNKGNKVKPGYKRKIKTAVDKVKKKHRREVIQKDIRRQRVERYRKEGINNGRK